MGLFDKFLDVMKLSDDDDDYYDDDEFEDDDEDEEPHSLFGRKENSDKKEEKKPVKATNTKASITPLRSVKKGASNMGVCVIKPTSYEDVKDITEALLSDQTVILNMEGIDLSLAQRIIDFTSGACYSIDGALQKVSNYIFILTPSSVDISGDLQELMGTFDFAGIQTGF